VRYILCYNPERAEEGASSREKALGEAERELVLLRDDICRERKRRGRKLTQKGLMLKVAKILGHGLAKFFQVSYDGKQLAFSRKEEAITREALRDGMFLIKTDCSLPAAQVVAAYKNLFGVERAMREIKDFLKLRPIYHYNAGRVRAHVLICVLAYLFEQWFEVLSRRKVAAEAAKAGAIPDEAERKRNIEKARASLRTGRKIVETLGQIKAVKQVFAGKQLVSVTRPGPKRREVLSILGMTPPPALLLPG
jgi:transposase